MISRRDAFEAVDEVRQGDLGRVVGVEVDVGGFVVELDQLGFEVVADLAEDRFEVAPGVGCHRSNVCSLGVEARYNYRLRVNKGQARSLQQVFDSCRFVWNTALGRWSDLWRHEQVRLSFVGRSRE